MTSTLIQKRRSHRHRKELEKTMWNWQQKVELYSHKLRNACKRQYRFFLMAFGGQATLPTPWFQTSGLQTNEIFNSFYFKPLSLQWFGTSALRNRMVNWIQCLRQICSSGRGQGSCLSLHKKLRPWESDSWVQISPVLPFGPVILRKFLNSDLYFDRAHSLMGKYGMDTYGIPWNEVIWS